LDSRATLEVYAQVQQRLSRNQRIASSLDDAENGAIEGHDALGGPLKWSTNTN
jgi:hypothetical protein